MLTVEQARQLIDDHARALPAHLVPLDEALGLALAENVAADMDSPPFDKALVDGYAVRSSELATGESLAFEVVEEVPAGRVPTRGLGAGQATAIMTGAPLPAGADAVVMLEKAIEAGTGKVLLSGPISPGQNRLARGREYGEGGPLLGEGALLSPARIGLLAAAGRTNVRVVPRPRVAVVSTGDELVESDKVPAQGRIRDSNAPMLRAFMREAGAVCLPPMPIARDDRGSLSDLFRAALEDGADVLVVSGGVSAGRRDLVPSVLEGLDVRPVFHKVRLKPGKPLWFGVAPRGQLVFGLPGNPVSGIVGALLFVAPAIRSLRGVRGKDQGPLALPAKLAVTFSHRGDRPTYHPARIVGSLAGVLLVEPLAWAGSPDLLTVTRANGYLHFPAGDMDFEPGSGPLLFHPTGLEYWGEGICLNRLNPEDS